MYFIRKCACCRKKRDGTGLQHRISKTIALSISAIHPRGTIPETGSAMRKIVRKFTPDHLHITRISDSFFPVYQENICIV
ncbi:MAG TPA: hypothetical protein DCG49_03895 [Ruminococcus sp.]|nr:hypothetical protein [Ruminococcus sp.]